MLRGWSLAPDVVDAAALLVTELATNAVRHGCGDLVVNMTEGDGLIRVSVHDDASAQPCQGTAAADDDEGGRGLSLVDAVSLRWGTRAAPGRGSSG